MSISVIGAHTATGQSTSGITTSGWSSTAASVFVALVSFYSAAGIRPDILDSKSNTWSQVGTTTGSGGQIQTCAFKCIPSSTGSSHTVTLNPGSGSGYTDLDLCVIEIGGADTTTPIDASGLAAASTGTSSSPSNTTNTLSQANELIVGMSGVFSANTFTEDGNFTNQAILTCGGDNIRLCVGTKIVASTTAVTYNPTLSGSTSWACLAIPVKEAAAAGISMAVASHYYNQMRG
jgi:hypothetical protein